ncbi:D-alanine--D-alanine ligase [Haloferula sargassicola]|uniref:D-alanine--D-alanine ligase n=1 Tax=Haloferula sargassicola TaxID=490096 RepID=A0ABP9UUN2_9BACT
MSESPIPSPIDGLVAVLMGGPGSEREVSLASGKAVAKALRERGVEVAEVDVTGPDFTLPEGCVLAFNLIHGTYGEDGGLQADLERRGIPYTGAGVESSRVAFDKHLAKVKFIADGVPTPASETIDLSRNETPSMSLPYVVKSPCQGSSVGVYIVRTKEESDKAIQEVAQYGDTALIEQFVAGRELTVAVLDDTALPVVEIVAPGGVYDMASKYPWLSGAQGSQYFCPAELDEETRIKVQKAALAAHLSLGIEIYSRVDVLLDDAGEPFVLEANTIPGMTETSLLPKSAAAAGIDFSELCLRIGRQGLELGTR